MRRSRFSQTEFDGISRRESLRDSNPTVLMAWAFWDAPISDSRETSAEVLTTTGVLDFCGAYVTVSRTFVLSAAWESGA